jgi:hypothetical protein
MWFALAALIPVSYYFLFSRTDGKPQFGAGLPIFGGSSALTVGAPVLIAGICGLLLGSTILDAEETRSAGHAIARGFMIALLSYLLSFTSSAVILAFNSDDLVGLVVFLVITFLYGLLIVGWPVAGVGAVAGWLLYRYRLAVNQEA